MVNQLIKPTMGPANHFKHMWPADGDFLMSYIVMMSRQIA